MRGALPAKSEHCGVDKRESRYQLLVAPLRHTRASSSKYSLQPPASAFIVRDLLISRRKRPETLVLDLDLLGCYLKDVMLLGVLLAAKQPRRRRGKG